MFIPLNGGQGISRPFVVGLILLLVFLGMQSDLVPSKQADSESTTKPNSKGTAKEKIILELSKSNEKLERELHQVQQQLLLVKHAAHQQGITHDSPLGSMLYAENLASILSGNATASNDTSSGNDTDQAMEPLTAEESLLQSEASSKTTSRRELPSRTHHRARPAAAEVEP